MGGILRCPYRIASASIDIQVFMLEDGVAGDLVNNLLVNYITVMLGAGEQIYDSLRGTYELLQCTYKTYFSTRQQRKIF